MPSRLTRGAMDPAPPEEVATPDTSITLQVLLRREWRTPDGVAKALDVLRANGLTPTGSGAATISATIPVDKFEEMFGVKATQVAPQPPDRADFGRSGGYVSPDLKVPDPLVTCVDSISAAPSHSYY
ncbi:hypothetical protein UP10_22030 [Bradyrhizobium sp. LTSPM299]|nr:hypothetical protein UP10_22030 [Bradyrhizobium sp. LTSPM299]